MAITRFSSSMRELNAFNELIKESKFCDKTPEVQHANLLCFFLSRLTLDKIARGDN